MGKTERLIRKGALQERRERLQELQIKIDRLIKDINYNLYTFNGIEALKVDHAEQAMGELVVAKREYDAVKEEIKKMEEEYG